MLNKCANPDCSTPLIYLREGKIFMMDQSADPKSKIPVKFKGHVEHFWLCGPCSRHLTVVYQPGNGVWVLPKEPKVKRVAAS